MGVMSQADTTWTGSPYLFDLYRRKDAPPQAHSSIPLPALLAWARYCLGPECRADIVDMICETITYYALAATEFETFFGDETLNPGFGTLAGFELPDDEAEADLVAPLPTAVIGVIDDAVPVVHQMFDLPDGSRIFDAWFQGARPADHPRGLALPFGRRAGRGRIRKVRHAIGSAGVPDERAAYQALGAIDRTMHAAQMFDQVASHGAGVSGSDIAKAAPGVGYMAVSLPAAAVRDTSGSYLPFFVVLGVLYLIRRTRALSRRAGRPVPLVLNLSYGVLAGPKDGSGTLEHFFNMLAISEHAIPDLGKVDAVLPMGNGRLSQSAARIEAGQSESLHFLLLPDDRTPTYIETWSAPFDAVDAPAALNVQIAPPGMVQTTCLPDLPSGTFADLFVPGGGPLRVYALRRPSGAQWRDMMLLAFSPTFAEGGSACSQPGAWQIWVESPAGQVTDLYVQRDDSLASLPSGGRQARFADPHYHRFDQAGRLIAFDPDPPQSPIRRSGTVNAFANGAGIMRVGGGYAQDPDGGPAIFSALSRTDPVFGRALRPAAHSRVRFELTAQAMLSGARERRFGTSFAAPQVAVALANAHCAQVAEPAQ